MCEFYFRTPKKNVLTVRNLKGWGVFPPLILTLQDIQLERQEDYVEFL